jgi:hypothetical protein
MPDEEAPAKATGNMLTRKVGPLPLWAYGVIGGGAGFLYLRWRKAKKGTTASQGTPGQAAASPTGLAGLGYSTGQNLGGADNSGIDSQLQGFGQQLGNLQQQITALQGSASTAGSSSSLPEPGGTEKQPSSLPPVVTPPSTPAPVQGSVNGGVTPGIQNLLVNPIGTSGGWLQYQPGANPWQEGLLWSPDLFAARGGAGGSPPGFSAPMAGAPGAGKASNYG